jgi:hypothetical protein
VPQARGAPLHIFLKICYIINTMKNKFYLFGLAVILSFVLPPLSLFGQAEIGMPAGLGEADLKKLIDKPSVIAASVGDPRKIEGKEWFNLSCDTHVVTSVSIDKIYATLNDFTNFAKNFGAKKVEVLRTTEQGKIVQATAGKLGVNSTYVYLQTEPVDTATEHLIVKIGQHTDGDDDTTRNMDTQYYMKTVTIDGKTYTYIRNKDYTDYLGGRIPFQYTAMKNNNESSHKDGLDNLVKKSVK